AVTKPLDLAYPSPCQCSAGSIRSYSECPCKRGILHCPFRGKARYQTAKLIVPFGYELCVCLKMELRAIDGTSDTIGLMRRHIARCHVDCILRQRKRIAMPMKDWKGITCRGQDRIALAIFRKPNLPPAELHGSVKNVLATICARYELAAQTNAESGLIAAAKSAYKFQQMREIRTFIVGERVLLTAKNDQGLISIVVHR